MKPKPIHAVTASIVLDTRITRKGGYYPVKLRLIHDRTAMYYKILYNPERSGATLTETQQYWLQKQNLGISMTPLEFADTFNQYTPEEIQQNKDKDKKGEVKPKKTNEKEPYRTMFLYLTGIVSDAQEVIAGLSHFTFEAFKEAFFEQPKDNTDIVAAIKTKATRLKNEGKIATADIYQNTLNALQEYTHQPKLNFNKVTPDFLRQFEKGLYARTVGGRARTKKPKVERNISRTTVSMYMRCLRSVFNESAPEGTPYPFHTKKDKEKDRKYIIPQWTGNKRALTQEQVSRIAWYTCDPGSLIHQSRDYWLFSYLCNGMNFKDLANLRYSNIKGEELVFERAKTTINGKVTQVRVIITRQIGRIIDQWGQKPGTPDKFIFPILTPDMTPEKQHATIKQLVKTTNKYIRKICSDLEIPDATTYTARHSFATVLKRSGASLEFISESLGHNDPVTTKNYLADFEIEEKRKWAEKLLPDINNQ